MLTLRRPLSAIRCLILLLLVVNVCGVDTVEAQQTRALPRVGVLWPGDVKPWNDSFLDGLRKQGYSDGVTVNVDIRNTVGNSATAQELAEAIVARDPDAIFAVPAPLAKHVIAAVERSRKKIPIVVLCYDPVEEGLTTLDGRRSITGVGVAPQPELMTKHLQLLRDMLPTISRAGYLVDATSDAGRYFNLRPRAALESAGEKIGIRVTSIELRSAEQLQQAFSDAVRAKVQALIIPVGPMVLTRRAEIIRLAAQHRLPVVYGSEIFPREGGLMSYWTSGDDVHRRAGEMVGQILDGRSVSAIPIEYPTRFHLVVNLKTAEEFGLKLPSAVMIQADEIIR